MRKLVKVFYVSITLVIFPSLIVFSSFEKKPKINSSSEFESENIQEMTLERDVNAFALNRISPFKITVTREGIVSYKGDYSDEFYKAKKKGSYEGRISDTEFNRLAELVKAMRFFDIEEYYEDPGAPTDQWSTLVTIKTDRRSKKIGYYLNAGPSNLHMLSDEIIRLIDNSK